MTSMDWRHSVVESIRAAAQPVNKFGHQPRLYVLAQQIGEGMEYDDNVLFAAAWMHDLGVSIGHRPADQEKLAAWNHVPHTVARACDLLAGWGFLLPNLMRSPPPLPATSPRMNRGKWREFC